MSKNQASRFLMSWFVSAVIIYAFSLLFAASVVLGNDKINNVYAAIVSALVVAIVNYFVSIHYRRLGLKVKDEYMAVLAYFLADVVVIWVIKRFALTTGLGVANNFYVLVLAAAISGLKVAVDSGKIWVTKKS